MREHCRLSCSFRVTPTFGEYLMKKSMKKPLAVAVGTTFVAAMAASPIANADTNPFGMQKLDSGYMQVAEGKCGESKAKEAKCGEGKMKKMKEEGKCGEGKCGEGKMKKMNEEGKCGEGKMKKEAKCGGNK
jgi:uncharacterized low-complexity protein